MKVVLLAAEAPQDFAARADKGEEFQTYMGEWYAFSDFLKETGAVLADAALEVPSAATTVTVRNGVRTVEDGPYPDTKEQLGGFFVLEAPDLKTAAEWAKRCPAAKNGFVEVRPILDLGEAAQ